MSIMLLAKMMTGSLQRAPQTAKRNKYKAVFLLFTLQTPHHTDARMTRAF